MTSPYFEKKVSGDNHRDLYELKSGNAGPDIWAGYLSSSGANLGDNIFPSQTCPDVGGVYLFFNDQPQQETDFVDDLSGFLKKVSPDNGIRILWIKNPQSPSSSWQWNFLDATAEKQGKDEYIWSVARQTRLGLGAYSMVIEPGAIIEIESDFSHGISFSANDVTFLAPSGAYSAQQETALIPFVGPNLGCLTAYLTLSCSEEFSGLDVMLRYGTQNPNPKDQPFSTAAFLNMPVIHLPDGKSADFHLSLDPFAPDDPERSYLNFFFAHMDNDPPALNSGFKTSFGVSPTLTPVDPGDPFKAARLVFNHSTMTVPGAKQKTEDLAEFIYYLTPDGVFSLGFEGAAAGKAHKLMLGLSAIEYIDLPAPSENQPYALCYFEAGKPAFSLPASIAQEAGSLDISHTFTNAGTTAHVCILPYQSGSKHGLTYYAQPIHNALFQSSGTEGYLEYLKDMPVSLLPTYTTGDGTPPETYAIGCYSNVDSSQYELAHYLENLAIAPYRRHRINAIGTPADITPIPIIPPTPPLDQLEDIDIVHAITPKGLLAWLKEDKKGWLAMIFAHMPQSIVHKQLSMTPIGPRLQGCLQSNQTFFVVSNAEVFNSDSGISEDTIADMSGWHFNLSTDQWRSFKDDKGTLTMMVFKFCDRSLAEMASDTRHWSWPDAAIPHNGQLSDSYKALQPFLINPNKTDPKDPLQIFYDRVVNNPKWNGILFLNAPISINSMPPALKFLSAGVDPEKFYAHHVGFSITPFNADDKTIKQQQTAAFGLINYEDPVDLYSQETIPFGFKTKQLLARFSNATLVDFKARAELLTNILFGAEMTKSPTKHGNNLVLEGGYQLVHKKPVYSFVLSGENTFYSQDSALESVEILGVQLQTKQDTQDGNDLVTEFTLRGNMKFKQFLPFDLFSYGDGPSKDGPVPGYLRFGNLSVDMTFEESDPTNKTFSVAEDKLNFDTANSAVRKGSLVNKFPLTLSGFAAPKSGKDATPQHPDKNDKTPAETSPKDQGFVSVLAPIHQSNLGNPWYGLIFTLDLGSLGALAGNVGLSIKVLAAWAPGQHDGDTPVYVGLEMPNGKSLEHNLPLQGILNLGFKSFQFDTFTDEKTKEIGYMLRLQQFALKILSLSFPPGNADVVIFGDPNGGTKKLGWYAAYTKDTSKGPLGQTRAIESQTAETRRLKSGRLQRPTLGGL